MKTRIGIIGIWIIGVGSIVWAADPPAEEWVDIPVVVNIIDASDASKLDDAVKKANEILAQAKIRLVVKKTNKNVALGNGDGKVTKEEAEKALDDGQKELDKTFQDKDGKWTGKGIKLTIADDAFVEEPDVIGWAVHRIPVVAVESGDADQMGSSLVHELLHALTIEDHSTDPNNVMYESDEGGTKIDKDQIKEIFPEAKKRGDTYSKRPSLLPETNSLAPSGVERHLDAFGAMLDPIGDVQQIPGAWGDYNPSDPRLLFADLREIQLFADDPSTPGTTAQLDIDLGGLLPDPGTDPFAMFITAEFDGNPDVPGLDARLMINGFDSAPSGWQAILQPINPPASPQTLPVQIHLNHQFDTPVPIPHHHSLTIPIPIEIVPMHLTSVNPILVTINSRVTIPPVQPYQFHLGDSLNSFSYGYRRHGIHLEDFFGEVNFIPNGVTGLLGPLKEVEVRLNGLLIGHTTTNASGVFEFTGFNTPPGDWSVIIIEADDGVSTPAHAIGYFHVPQPTSTLRADLNGDGCVDIIDLSIVSQEWLTNCIPPSM